MAKKAKRGVKPGTKRGPYRRNKIIKGLREAITFKGDAISLAEMDAAMNYKVVGKSINLTLCEQLEETITRLENRVSNSIARINALIGQI